MNIWELSLFWGWFKITYTSTLWRFGIHTISFNFDHLELGVEICVGPFTFWIGYIGKEKI